MLEEYKKLCQEEIIQNARKFEIDNSLAKIQHQKTEILSKLVGKCFFNQSRASSATAKHYVKSNDGNRRECCWLEEQYKVFQIIGLSERDLVIQQWNEEINIVLPDPRLTYKCYIQRISVNELEKMLDSYKEISIDEYLGWIKEMDFRDSYCCWKTICKII